MSSIETFFYIIAKYPEIQKRAQAEIDAVIGSGRLPISQDRTSLPYVEALYREVLRWMPALPLGVPHSTSEEDTFGSYYIPKGE